MKKNTFFRIIVLAFMLVLSFETYSQNQNYKAFTPRFDQDVTGDMVLIGNNIINTAPANTSYNGTGNNNGLNMQYIDVDGDASTFSSSTGDLKVPSVNTSCYKIVYAALYWAGIYDQGTINSGQVDRTKLGNVKFKLPTGGYNNITGTLIYDYGNPANPAANQNTSNGTQKPYAYYADVTNLVKALTGPTGADGTYTVANITSGLGTINGGFSAGWNLFIIYDDPAPTATTKSITSFDGFSFIQSGGGSLNIPITGFKTKLSGPVKAKVAFSALEGDVNNAGDALLLNGIAINTTQRPINDFFNSTINDINGPYTTRNPASNNTLGYDVGIFNVPNGGAANTIIKNGDTSATLTLQTVGDGYGIFFNAFAVEIIAPRVQLIKKVFARNTAGIYKLQAQGSTLNLGQQVQYAITFTNKGNGDATKFSIKDVLPANFVYTPGNFTTSDPTRVIVTEAGNTLTFTLKPEAHLPDFATDPQLSPADGGTFYGDPSGSGAGQSYTVNIFGQVQPDCSKLLDACSNQINNVALKTYYGLVGGVVSPLPIENQQSSSYNTDTCGADLIGSSNVLESITNCNFNSTVTLCKTTVPLTAANGYTSYQWYKIDPTGTTIPGTTLIGKIISGATSQTYNAPATGQYVVADIIGTCQSIQEVFTVNPTTGVVASNPIIPFADKVENCVSLGIDLPKIFLCGATATKTINLNYAGATLKWDKLDEVACPPPAEPAVCPNTTSTTTCWAPATGSAPGGTGNTFTANQSGKYRLTITSTAGGCFLGTYYFSVYQNVLNPTAVATDIICNTPGKIVVSGVPNSGYEFQYTTAAVPSAGGYVANQNTFTTNTPGSYNVFIRQNGGGVGNCVFTIPNQNIVARVQTVNVILTQPICNGNTGTVRIQILGVAPQYSYTILNGSGATVAGSSGFINSNDVTYNLTPGTYTVNTLTSDGCSSSQQITLNNPPAVAVAIVQTTTLTTCSNGAFTVTPSGGTAPYIYYVNGDLTKQYSSNFTYVVTTPGTYTITGLDNKGCPFNGTIDIPLIPAPVFTISKTDVLCYGNNTGQIVFNVTNLAALGATNLMYSIATPANYVPGNTFSNLTSNTYNAIIKYTYGGVDCYTTPQSITINQPATGLTAVAGVSELAGCDPANTGFGRIKISNENGGVPFTDAAHTRGYEYNFTGNLGNAADWVTTNEQYVAPGTYDVYVRDSSASGCPFKMTVTVAPDIAPPTITVGAPVFNCNGTATETVTINNNGGSFTYNYFLDGVANTPITNNVFTNVISGAHTVRVEYVATGVSTYSNLLNEDFGIGDANVTTPGIAAAYCWNSQPYPAGQPCGNNAVPGFGAPPCGAWTIEDNQYSVTKAINPNNCNWFPYRDHTTNGTNPLGRFLAINIGSAAGNFGILYSKKINDITPNQPIKVDLWLANLLRTGVGGADPDFKIELVDASGTVVATQNTGVIDNIVDAWQHPPTITLNPGNNTSLTFNIRSGSILYNGNDAAIDDINVYQIPKVCKTAKDFPITVQSGKAFTASISTPTNITCFGAKNGSTTITAANFDPTYGFDYRVDGGAWINSGKTGATSVVINNLGSTPNPHKIEVVYNSTNATGIACTSPIPDFPIVEPAPLVASAIVNPQPTCLTGATITASATGGTGAYQYQLVTSAGAVVPAYPTFQSSNTFTNIPAGTYLVTVKDGNGCSDPTDAVLTVTATVAPTATLSFNCNAGAGETVVVNATGGVPFTDAAHPDGYEYQLNGAGAWLTSKTFTLLPGSYTFIARDKNSCQTGVLNHTVAAQLLISAVKTKDIDCTGTPGSIITITYSGGTPTTTYQISINGGAYGAAIPLPASPFTLSPTAGTYTYKITDGALPTACTVTTTPITITNPTNPTGTATPTQATCGNNNGTVTLAATAGSGSGSGYTYSFNGSAFTSTTVYTGLAPGTYPYKIRDSKQCEFSSTVTVTTPNLITGTATLTQAYTCTTTGTITVTNPSGGVPAPGPAINGYTYSIGGAFQASNIFTGLTNGSYTVTIKDSNGCTGIVSPPIVIAPLNPPTALTFSSTPVVCNASGNGTTNVTVSASNPSGSLNTPLVYSITAPSAIASDVPNGQLFSNLSPGINYTFQVTDSKGCSTTNTLLVPVPLAFKVDGNKTNDVLCKGDATGNGFYSLRDFVIGRTYSYTINTTPVRAANITPTAVAGSQNIPLTLVPAGTYTITVTDNTTTCKATAVIVIGEAASLLTINPPTLTQLTCTPANGGAAIINATGGTTPYTYVLTPPSGVVLTQNGVNNTFFGLSVAGTYNYTVTDANGCIKLDSFVLNNPGNVKAIITQTLCYNTTASNPAAVTVNALPAGPVYNYSKDGGVTTQVSATFGNLQPNINYQFVAIDAVSGCKSAPIALTIPDELKVTATQTKDLNCLQDATLQLTVTGGTSTYKYEVSKDGGTTFTAPVALPSNPYNYNVTAANFGNYVFRITDSNTLPAACSVTSTSINIPALTPLVAGTPLTSTPTKCNGSSDGGIDITNLYTGVGGTPGYGYEVFGPNSAVLSKAQQVTNLPAGNYIVRVTDAKLCTVDKLVTISQPAAITFTATPTDIGCGPFGDIPGSIAVTATAGGSGTYIYTLTSTNPSFVTIVSGSTPSTTMNYPNLGFGTYTVRVQDVPNGCFLDKTVTIGTPPNGIAITGVPTTVCLPVPSSTMSIQANAVVVGGGPFTFSYIGNPNPPQGPDNILVPTVATFTNLQPGSTYTFYVANNAGCKFYQALSTPPTNATIVPTALPSKNLCVVGTNDASVNFRVTTIDPTSATITFQIRTSLDNLPVAGTLTTIAINANGTFPIPGGGTYTVTGAGTPGAVVTVNNFGTLGNGTYYVTVSENGGPNAGCTNNTSDIKIGLPPSNPVTLSLIAKNTNCTTTPNGTITATGSGGDTSAPYQYQIFTNPSTQPADTTWFLTSPNAFENGVFTRIPGTYDVYVRDANGCIAKQTVTIGTDTNPVVTANLVDPCVAEDAFQIQVTRTIIAGNVALPNGLYNYVIDGAAPIARPDTFTLSGLHSGSHTINIIDGNGCTMAAPITINIYPPLKGTAPVTYTTTNCGANGVITVNPAGGSNTTYTYTISPVAGTLAGNVFSNVPGGSYTITIKDTNATLASCSFDIPVTIIGDVPVTIGIPKIIAPSCLANNPVGSNGNGQVIVQLPATNTDPSYTYTLTGTVPVVAAVANANGVFTGLASGDYTLDVKSDKTSCSISTSITVPSQPALSVNGVAGNFSCDASNNPNSATYTLTGAGGTAPYHYSINGTDFSNTTGVFALTDPSATSQTGYVKDANGCIAQTTTTVTPLNPIVATVAMKVATLAQPTRLSCTNPEVVVITATGGTGGTFTYQSLSSGAIQLAALNEFSLPAVGDYYFKVLDANGCYQTTAKYTVAPYGIIDIQPTTTPVTCFGVPNGTIVIAPANITSYTGTYNYTLLDGAGNPVAPAVTGSGDTTTTTTISGLTGGNYIVAITETAYPFCTANSTVVTVDSPSLLTVAAKILKNDNCNTPVGQIQAIAEGGKSGYTYQILPVASAAPTSLSAGWSTDTKIDASNTVSYIAYVKDANGCIAASAPIAVPLDPTPAITAVVNNQCTGTEGTFAIDVTRTVNGIAPYEIFLDGNLIGVNNTTPFTITGLLSSATHSVQIKDANGCGNTVSPIVILPPLAISTNVDTLPSCSLGGQITVSATGGSGVASNYRFESIAPSATIVPQQASGVFAGLIPGDYYFKVTDISIVPTNCDVVAFKVNLPAPTPVTFDSPTITNVRCNGGNDGAFTVNIAATNDNPVYTYQIISGPVGFNNTIQNTTTFTGLTEGTIALGNPYIVEVTSGRGCKATQTIEVTQPNPIVVPPVAIATVEYSCTAGTNTTNMATITVDPTKITGGSGTYSIYEFIRNGVLPAIQKGNSPVYTETDLLGGSYTINVYDSKGCLGTITPVVIDPFVKIDNLTVTIDKKADCSATPGESITVGVDVTPIAGTVNLSYNVKGFAPSVYNVTQATPNFTGLLIGSYEVTVINLSTGCSVNKIIYVDDPNTFDLTLTPTPIVCYNDTNGSVAITLTDRVTPPDESGAFSYVIKDSAGVPVPGKSGITANAGPVIVTGLARGSYTVEATLTGTPFCTTIKGFSISGPPTPLTIVPSSTPITCVAGNNDGTIAVAAQGGWTTLPYQYQLEKGGVPVASYDYATNKTNANFIGLTAGSYVVKVRDILGIDNLGNSIIGCEVATLPIVLVNPTPIAATATAAPTALSCKGDTNATITVNLPVTGGQGTNYSYALVNNTSGVTSSAQTTNVFPNLGAGTYNVIVTDAWSCQFTTPLITINEPLDIIEGKLILATPLTCTPNSATLNLSAVGGTPPYTYSTTATGVFIPLVGTVTLPATIGKNQYFVKDANNCIIVGTNEIVVDPIVPLKVDITNGLNQIVNCNGGTTTITAIAHDGLGNYVYTLIPMPGGVTQNPVGTFNNVPLGTYNVSVMSVDCNVTSQPITVIEPPKIIINRSQTNVTCNGDKSGTITVIGTGGTGKIQFSINTDPLVTLDKGEFGGLAASTTPYLVSVQDGNGCDNLWEDDGTGTLIAVPNPIPFTITEPTPIQIADTSPGVSSLVITNEACLGDGGEIKFTVTGGTPGTTGYTAEIGNNSIDVSGNLVFTPLAGVPKQTASAVPYNFDFVKVLGSTTPYDVLIKDANGCILPLSMEVKPGIDMQEKAEAIYPCTGDTPDRNIVTTVNPSVPITEFTFTLDSGTPTAITQVGNGTFLNVSVGLHTVTIVHKDPIDPTNTALFCTKTTPAVDVVDYGKLTLTLAESGLNKFLATTLGGKKIYHYSLDGVNQGTTDEYEIFRTADYTVVVTDANGCTDTKMIHMVYIDIKIPNFFTPDGSGANNTWKPLFTDNFPDIITEIFDRYGRKITTLSQPQSWDGTYNGNSLPSGDYWYVIKLNRNIDARQFVGHFTLYR